MEPTCHFIAQHTHIVAILGMVITEAKNGKEAVDIYKQSELHTFDYIFVDIMMPVMDGLDATRQIRKLNREDAQSIPIIAMTANAFAEDKKACMDAGMTAHITKPLKLETIVETLWKIQNQKDGKYENRK